MQKVQQSWGIQPTSAEIQALKTCMTQNLHQPYIAITKRCCKKNTRDISHWMFAWMMFNCCCLAQANTSQFTGQTTYREYHGPSKLPGPTTTCTIDPGSYQPDPATAVISTVVSSKTANAQDTVLDSLSSAAIQETQCAASMRESAGPHYGVSTPRIILPGELPSGKVTSVATSLYRCGEEVRKIWNYNSKRVRHSAPRTTHLLYRKFILFRATGSASFFKIKYDIFWVLLSRK